MPLALLQYKKGQALKEIAECLALQLPHIIAPALTLSERDLHDGQVTPGEIVVWCVEGGAHDVNTRDIEIIIWAHDFLERAANLEGRKDAIIKGVHRFLADYDRDISGFVWVLLQPTAFGYL
ncbi:MAG: hypothetical protein AAB805_02210 [Patescibacteria group bacterium]